MRIILNSDVLHTERPLATGLPVHLERFCREAATAGAVLVLPRTTLLENDRHQRQLTEQEITAISNAMAILGRWGVKLPTIDAQTLVEKGDLLAMLRATGIQVEVEEPLLEDYREAERRACLHLSPQPPDAKSDEMRDLVIWAVALRLARKDGRAILISRDTVHSDERGEAEAEAVGLLRTKEFDGALDLIGRESPAGIAARSMLGAVWDNLRAAGLPLPAKATLRKLTGLSFIADEEGNTRGRLSFVVDGPAGQLSGTANIVQAAPDQIRVDLTGMKLNGTQWQTGELSIVADGELPRIAQPSRDRLEELRTVLEDRR